MENIAKKYLLLLQKPELCRFHKNYFFNNNRGKPIFVREMCVLEWMGIIQALQHTNKIMKEQRNNFPKVMG